MLPGLSVSASGGQATGGTTGDQTSVFAPAYGAFAVGGKGNTGYGGTASAAANGSGAIHWGTLAIVAGVALAAWLLSKNFAKG